MSHVDPVCRMEIEEEDSVGTVVHDGVTYYFAAKGRALPARTLAILYVALRRWRQRVRLADHHQRLDEPDLRRDRLEQARPVQDEAPSRRFHQHLFNPRLSLHPANFGHERRFGPA